MMMMMMLADDDAYSVSERADLQTWCVSCKYVFSGILLMKVMGTPHNKLFMRFRYLGSVHLGFNCKYLLATTPTCNHHVMNILT